MDMWKDKLNCFKRNLGWMFIREDLSESREGLDNPARGWYQIYTFYCDIIFDSNVVEGCLSSDESLVLILIDIGAYRKDVIDKSAILNMKNILEWFAAKGKDIILRVVYDHEGKGMEREPVSFVLVKKHMTQIAELLDALEQKIFLYQGLLLGSWGEMHDSKYLTLERLVELEKILTQSTMESFYAVRSPKYWRWLREEADYLNKLDNEHMGVFDDGIIGSDTNLGTFGFEKPDKGKWLHPWHVEYECLFLKNISRYVPIGGEAVFPQNGAGVTSLQQNIQIIKDMHITYLNRIHDKRLLDTWHKLIWESDDIWNGCSGFEYIGNHLGYRFVIRNVKVSIVKRNKQCIFELELENVGFANLYQETEVFLEWRTADENVVLEQLDVDLRKLDSGCGIVVTHSTNLRTGTVYIMAKRKLDGKIIKFANICDNSEKIKVGTLTVN